MGHRHVAPPLRREDHRRPRLSGVSVLPVVRTRAAAQPQPRRGDPPPRSTQRVGHCQPDRHQLTDWLSAAERRGGDWWAAATLLGLNGLRCGELVACDVTDVGSHSWHHCLALRTTKGDKPTVIALAPPTMQAIEAAIAGRSGGPLLRNAAG